MLSIAAAATRKAISVASSKLKDAKQWAVQKTAAVIDNAEQAGSRAYNTVTKYAKEGYDKTTTAVETAYHAAAKAATATISYVKFLRQASCGRDRVNRGVGRGVRRV